MELAVECAVLSLCLQTNVSPVSAAWAGVPAVEVVVVTVVEVVVAAEATAGAVAAVAAAGAVVECWGCIDQVTW